jgi:hypothetical protein
MYGRRNVARRGTATNKSIPLRGNSCAVSKPHKKSQIEIAHVELFTITPLAGVFCRLELPLFQNGLVII